MLAVFVGRTMGTGLKLLRPSGGSVLPGIVALSLDDGLIRRLSARFRTRIVVTGTNGKTTTTHLISSFLAQAGWQAATNAQGANMRSGIASMLLSARGDTLVLEIDENALRGLAPEIDPTLVVVTGLFRDQLDRFGEVETLRRRLAATLAPLDATLLLNADDPLAASLAEPQRTRYFAVEGLPALSVPADTTSCPQCDTALVYRSRSYAHLGDYRCPKCGFARPLPDFTLKLGDGEALFNGTRLPQPPDTLHPNSLAAALAACATLGLETPAAWPEPAWGRGETGERDGRRIVLSLAKNPASLSFSLAWQKADALAIEINDGGADGRDVSWLWDMSLPARLGPVATCGTRGLELLSRLRYAEPPVEAVAYASPADALAATLAATPTGGTSLFLSTYTGLRDAQALLHEPPAPATPTPLARLPRPRQLQRRDATLRLVHLFPDEMGTYGDAGNIAVLARRLAWRGYQVETVRVAPGDGLPAEADFFMLGGGEDRGQARTAAALASMRDRLAGWMRDGVTGLLVCGGLQLFGERYETTEGMIPGLGLMPLVTVAQPERLVGQLTVASHLVPRPLVGFENHGGRTRLVDGEALGRVLDGHGNVDDGAGGEGCVQGHVIATYLHGPVLARNPQLADVAVGWMLARRGLPAPEPLDDSIEELAAQRLLAERN